MLTQKLGNSKILSDHWIVVSESTATALKILKDTIKNKGWPENGLHCVCCVGGIRRSAQSVYRMACA